MPLTVRMQRPEKDFRNVQFDLQLPPAPKALRAPFNLKAPQTVKVLFQPKQIS